MELLKLKTHQELEELKEMLSAKKFKTIVFAGLDIDGNVITHFRGNESAISTYEYCGLLKFIENRISNLMNEVYDK